MFGLMARTPFTDRLPDLYPGRMDKRELMAALRQFLEAGKITPRIDKRHSLEQVSEAVRHMTQGRALGRIIPIP